MSFCSRTELVLPPFKNGEVEASAVMSLDLVARGLILSWGQLPALQDSGDWPCQLGKVEGLARSGAGGTVFLCGLGSGSASVLAFAERAACPVPSGRTKWAHVPAQGLPLGAESVVPSLWPRPV